MATDVVCVLDANLAQVFETARPIKAVVKEESKAMDHPLETGAVITDHRVLLPVEIELSLVLSAEDYRGTYRQIRDLFHKGELLTVQTRTESYQSMAIQSMPHEENADAFDVVMLALSLKEAQYVEAQFTDAKVARPRDSRTVQRGEQQPKAATSERGGSILSRLFK
jgi:hypothetical protein